MKLFLVLLLARSQLAIKSFKLRIAAIVGDKPAHIAGGPPPDPLLVRSKKQETTQMKRPPNVNTFANSPTPSLAEVGPSARASRSRSCRALPRTQFSVAATTQTPPTQVTAGNQTVCRFLIACTRKGRLPTGLFPQTSALKQSSQLQIQSERLLVRRGVPQRNVPTSAQRASTESKRLRVRDNDSCFCSSITGLRFVVLHFDHHHFDGVIAHINILVHGVGRIRR